MRVLINGDPWIDMTKPWSERGTWPANWISHPKQHADEPAVVAYRKRFSLSEKAAIVINVSADERYELFLDGERVGRGPERGDRENWFYETYEFELEAGDHIFVARTWWIGPGSIAPYAQMSVRPGFLMAASGHLGESLNTGVTQWECKKLDGYSWIDPGDLWGTGARVHIRGADYPWGFESGKGDDWEEAQTVGPARFAIAANEHPAVWMLCPAMLPAMLEEPRRVGEARHVQSVEIENTSELQVNSVDHLASEAEIWNHLLKGESSITIPESAMRRVIVDLGNYYTAYPEIVVSGGKGSKIRIHWAEGLFDWSGGGTKRNRDEIEAKFFRGIGDVFEPDGGDHRHFETLWWESGRYIEIFISTGDSPLVIESFFIRETHYPYEFNGSFESSSPSLAEVMTVGLRTLEMCSHETYMDCPYYEQLMYVGDTRLEALVTYAVTQDERLPRKALRLFDVSRKNSGLTQSRYPSRVMQIIPPFSLWWIGMVYDYAMWRNDPAFVANMMPGVRTVIDAFKRWINDDDLVEAPKGWNFMDWVKGWINGIPPDGDQGMSGVINWQFVVILQQAAELEELIGEPELAARNRKLADRVSKAAIEFFWDNRRGLFADDVVKERFSEHSQCLALLSGKVTGRKRRRVIKGLIKSEILSQTTIYFTHYLFETYRLIGRMDKFFERMELWFGLKNIGVKTTIESPEPSRSDCHAWGAHPIYHYFASILGIRPDAPGFEKVKIEPQLGPLMWAKGSLPHPNGFITVDFVVKGSQLTGTIELPEGVTGVLVSGGAKRNLQSGKQEISIKYSPARK